MKLKYYLQGFGIGVIFATLILSISFYSRKDNSNHTSREEIERLAAAYGMVYPQETKEGEANQETKSAGETETNKEDGTDGEMEASGEAESSRETEASGESGSSGEIETSGESGSSREIETSGESGSSGEIETSGESGSSREIETSGGSESDSETESIEESQSVQQDALTKEINITVVSGMYASSIAELLEETGVIEDAQEFNLYLIGEGYTRKLQAGVYTFTEGMDFETIAGKLLWETD